MLLLVLLTKLSNIIKHIHPYVQIGSLLFSIITIRLLCIAVTKAIGCMV